MRSFVLYLDVFYGHKELEYDLCHKCYNELASKFVRKEINNIESYSNSYDHLYKTIIIGDSNFGKSDLMSRWICNKFCESANPTIGIDFYNQNC